MYRRSALVHLLPLLQPIDQRGACQTMCEASVLRAFLHLSLHTACSVPPTLDLGGRGSLGSGSGGGGGGQVVLHGLFHLFPDPRDTLTPAPPPPPPPRSMTALLEGIEYVGGQKARVCVCVCVCVCAAYACVRMYDVCVCMCVRACM